MSEPYSSQRSLPLQAPPLAFDADDQQRAWDDYGSNCGPGAIAGLCGQTPDAIVKLLGPKFLKLRGTTEVMARDVLTRLEVDWRDVTPGWIDYGLLRIQWDGPWINDPDPYEKLRHSHWVGTAACNQPHPMIFDINAINVGGWIPLSEWDHILRPWLLECAEPQATGPWWISDAIEIDPQSCGRT